MSMFIFAKSLGLLDGYCSHAIKEPAEQLSVAEDAQPQILAVIRSGYTQADGIKIRVRYRSVSKLGAIE